jgi:hypothetical protein
MDMKVAVIGGGLFGSTAALVLADAGAEVHLYEKSGSLFGAASGVNQYRLHKGYHYPRSSETIRECRDSISSFKKYYGESVIGGVERYYAIAAKDSFTSADKYLSVLKENGLPFKVEKPICKSLELLIRVKEERVDHRILRNIAMIKMAHNGVEVFLNAPATKEMRDQYDHIVVAGYAGNNDILKTLGCKTRQYQYEVCEKPIIMLERRTQSWRTHNFKNFSLVVMDGPFCSLDPFGNTGWHVMGHVEHAIHSRNVGEFPEVPKRLQGYLDNGRIAKPTGTRWPRIKKASKKYLPFLDDALYQGSMFTVRVVLPKKDKTDERPTIVESIDPQVTKIFSGKLGTAVQAAHTTLNIVLPNHYKESRPKEQGPEPTGQSETTCKQPLIAQPSFDRLGVRARAAGLPLREQGSG